ncbi:Ig-like domain repeat protein [Salinispora arenicola]|uniref:RCC1 domain-containing protein n=1 Tax=Salinispora arenicola TaxID=168697 RepID=UPI0003768498|nr:Ig-like domain repeat protein [Salinispora arenicola]
MERLCQRPGRSAGVGRVGRAISGWCFLVLAVTVMQGATVWPAVAQPGSATPSGVASDTILAWGANNVGQLGDGSTIARNTPVAVSLPPDTTVTAVAGGDSHSLALTSAGAVLAWGENNFGQLGTGNNLNSSVPITVALPPDTTVVAIAADHGHSLALTSAGAVLAWGANNVGQLGNGNTFNSNTPVTVNLPPGTTVATIAAGTNHSLAITSTGAALAWGGNGNGQLGNNSTATSLEPIAVTLPPSTTITAIAAGSSYSLAITSTGTALAWGGNSNGQLGTGNNADSLIPIAVALPPGTTITSIAAGFTHSLAVTSTGTALAWGGNSRGQLGIGTTTNSDTPVIVNLPPDTTITTNDGGFFHSLGSTSTGAALAWGNNFSGQLGTGNNTNSLDPIAVALPSGTKITTIAAGGGHSLALVAPPTSTTLQVTPPNPTVGQDVTLTAAVTCNVDTPTGTITFRSNSTALATVPLTASSTATHVTTLPGGTHTLTADYISTNTCPNSQSTPVSVTINPPPDEPDLPITGPNMTAGIGAAALSILAGVILIYAARRRQPPHQPE